MNLAMMLTDYYQKNVLFPSMTDEEFLEFTKAKVIGNKIYSNKPIREEDKKVGCFEFQHLDMYGDVVNTAYRLDPSYEGYMVFFPAKLRHMVYPFYETEEPRISIAGNIWCKTKA